MDISDFFVAEQTSRTTGEKKYGTHFLSVFGPAIDVPFHVFNEFRYISELIKCRDLILELTVDLWLFH
jgi:hypothetical protein